MGAMVKPMTALLAGTMLLGACATVSPPTPVSAVPQERVSASEVNGEGTGLVSAADPRAAEAGAAMLRQGGSATDAAIASMLALTVVEPQSSGIGGGGFYVRATPDGTVTTIDGRETAPHAAGPDWFLGEEGEPVDRRAAVMSGLSVGVPGNIALAALAHEQHGALEWSALFAPSIALARDGWVLTERFVDAAARNRERGALTPEGRALFFDQAGEPLPAGTHVRNEAFAQTLERIAREGPQAFYHGTAAAELARVVAAETPHEQAMTAADLANYRATPRAPVCGLYRAYRICGMAPPSSGATTVYAILKQLEHFDLGALGPQSPTFWHLFAESQRLAYADRELYLADADHVAVPVAGLMDPDYLAARGALISPTAVMADVEAGAVPGAVPLAEGTLGEEGGTSHIVALDREGVLVSYTSTIEGPFGSGIVTGGYYLNNELTDFSFVPEQDGLPVANRVEGGKRPRSSMAPTVVYAPDGRLLMAVGAAGGATILVQVARALFGVIDFGLPVEQALALPVLYSPGDTVSVEAGSMLEAMIPALQALGHREVSPRELPLKANAALLEADGWMGAADPRSEGAAIVE